MSEPSCDFRRDSTMVGEPGEDIFHPDLRFSIVPIDFIVFIGNKAEVIVIEGSIYRMKDQIQP